MKRLLVYHVDLDGHTSIRVVVLAIGSEDTQLCELNYNADFAALAQTARSFETIIFVDFAPPQSFLDALPDKTILILDHHPQTATLKPGPSHEIVYKQGPNISGASIAWDYYFPNRPMPKIVEMVAKYDSWAWVSEEVVSPAFLNSYFWFLKAYDKTFEFIDGQLKCPNGTADDEYTKMKNIGSLLFEAEIKKGEIALKMGQYVEVLGVPLFAVNSMEPGLVHIARSLNKSYNQGPLLIWYMAETGKIKVSLRVADGGKFDAKAFARQFDGGGHTKAAAFWTTLSVMAGWKWAKQ